MAAAGVAVHLGLGQRALTIGELALERNTAMGADGSESRITLALAHCQIGQPDEALALLEEVAVETPYCCSVRALAQALTGDHDGAVADAQAVADDAGSSYLDCVIADIAAAGAEIGAGDADAATRYLGRARATALEAGDVVARELVTAAHEAMLAEPHRNESDHLGVGWRSVVEALGVGSAERVTAATDEPVR